MVTFYDPYELNLDVKSKPSYVGEVSVICPYHNDHKPGNAFFNTKNGFFYCFACDTGKNINQLVSDLGGNIITTTEIEEKKHDVEKNWKTLLKNPSAFDNDYLKSRLVNDMLVARYDIKQFDDGVIFPIYDKFEQVSGIVIRHYIKKPKYLIYGKKQPIWPMNDIKPGPLFVVEGIFGVLRANISNVWNCATIVGVRSALTSFNFLSKIGMVKPIAILDPDFAGRLASAKLILNGFDVILLKTNPDELNITQWQYVKNFWKQLKTNDIEDVFKKTENKEGLEKGLKTYGL